MALKWIKQTTNFGQLDYERSEHLEDTEAAQGEDLLGSVDCTEAGWEWWACRGDAKGVADTRREAKAAVRAVVKARLAIKAIPSSRRCSIISR